MTTAAVVAYYSQESKARISYAGHPPVLYWRAKDKVWSYARPPGRKSQSDGFPLNIPLAVDLDTLYGQLAISMIPGDRLFVYTDGSASKMYLMQMLQPLCLNLNRQSSKH
jgi:sigma-B regulation protein RsbU (phosphoserine phosphatase)